MSDSHHQNAFMLFTQQFRIFFQSYCSFFLSHIIIIYKIIVLIGLLITFFSDHWAINPISPYIYAGYKNRCSVHVCIGNHADPVWIIDITCLLSIINFIIELIIIFCGYCRIATISKIKIIMNGLLFLTTFILTDCLVIFGIYISIYTYNLPMGYAYYCFIMSIIFSIIDWGYSLRQIIVNWSETIYVTENELLLYNHCAIRISPIDNFALPTQQSIMSSDNLITFNNTPV